MELTDGWTGKIISTEWLFSLSSFSDLLPALIWNTVDVFDGVPVVISMVVYNIAHPGKLLSEDEPVPQRSVKEEESYWSFA